MKREREEEEEGHIYGAAMAPSLGLPSPSSSSSSAAAARVLLDPAMKGFHSLRAPSPFVRAMRTRLDPPPSLPDAAAPPVPLPLPPQIPDKRRRARPRNCDRLLPPPGFHLSPPEPCPTVPAHGHFQLGGLQAHVLKIDVGQDIVSRIVEVSKINGKAICVLSVLGAVQEANLLHSSSVITNHKGPLEVIYVFGSILTYDNPGFGSLSASLACADCSVVGGIVAGPLIAATPVQAIVGSFYNNAFQQNKTTKIITFNSSSQVATGNGISNHPKSCFANCNEITNHSKSEAAIATGSISYPDSKVTIGNLSQHCPDSQVPGSTSHSDSQFIIGNGSAHHSSYQVNVGASSMHDPNSQGSISSMNKQYTEFWVPNGNGSIHEPDSDVRFGIGGTNNGNSQSSVCDGSTRYPKCQAIVGNGSTHELKFQATVDDKSIDNAKSERAHRVNCKVCGCDGRSYCRNCKASVGDGSAPSTEGSNQENAFCSAVEVEQGESNETDVEGLQVVA